MTDPGDDPKLPVTLSQDAVEEIARKLWSAWQSHTKVQRSESDPWPSTLSDGYAIQDALARISGLHTIGWKIGASSDAAQDKFSAPGLMSGRIFAPYRHNSPASIDPRTCSLRALEPEIAIRLGRDFTRRDEPYVADDITSAIVWAQPALEIRDSRWQDWEDLNAPAFVADDAAAGHLILGSEVEHWQDIELADVEARLVINGETVATGRCNNILGGPLNAVAWLANHLIEQGKHLAAGDLVITGTCTPVGFAQPGDEVIADFGSFGKAVAFFE